MVSFFDSVAQLVEQLTLNQWVEGSSPSGVTIKMVKLLTMSDLIIFLFPNILGYLWLTFVLLVY